mmetsp:Transcript_43533/g.100211  ORF Transcript_43533/g.100211 Transcript_43533/m.100211 type:complete len:1079 (-) Transcript_43533:96-3332(-)
MGAGASSSAAYAVKTQHFIRPLGSSSASDGGAAFMAAASFAVCSFLELEYASQRKAVEALVDHAAETTGAAVHFFSVPQGRGRAKVKDDSLQEDAFMMVASSTLSPASRASSTAKALPTMNQVSVLQKAVDFGYASGAGGRMAAAEVRRAGHVDGVLLAELPAVASNSSSGNGCKSSSASGSRSIGEMAVVLWARTLSERLEAIRIDLEAKAAKQAIANVANTLRKVGEGSDGAKGALAAAMELVPLEALRAGISCDLVQVWVYDPHAGELVLTDGAKGLGDESIRVPAEHSLVGQTLTSSFGQVVCVRDVQADKRFNKAFDEKTGLTTATSVSLCFGADYVPDTASTAEDHVQAKVLQYVNTTRKDGSNRKVDHFDLVQAETLSDSHLGPMLQIKQHIIGLVEAERQRSAVQAVVALVGTLAESIIDLSEMLEQEIVGVMDCEDCTCFLVDDALDEMWAPPLRYRPEGIRMKIGEGILGHVAKLARDSPGEVTIWRDNAPHVSPFWSGEQIDGYLTRNLMVAPVYSSGKDPALLGLIQIVNKRVDKQQQAPGGRRKSVARSSFDDEDPRMGTTRTRKSIKVLEEEPLMAFQNMAPMRHFTRHDAHLLESLAENISGHLQRLVGDILFTKAAMDMQDGDALPKMITEFYNTGLPKSFTDAGGALMHALESLEETQSLGDMTMSPTISLAFDHLGSGGNGADLKSWAVDYWNLTLQDEFGLVRQAIVEFGLPAKLFVSQTRLAAFMNALKSNYRHVPYHNFHHAISTMHYCFKFLYESGIHEDLDHLDLYALLIGALCHDCDHRGCTNQFEVISRSDLAIRYNDNSPLENHHCARAFQIALSAGGAVPPPTSAGLARRLPIPSSLSPQGSSPITSPLGSRQLSAAPAPPESANTNIFEAMNKEAFSIVRQRMIAGILSTDMRHHGDHVRHLQTLRLQKGTNSNYISEKELHEVESVEVVSAETRQKLVELVLHAADIGSAFMPSHISCRFTTFLMEEFTAQVEQERALGLPVTAFMDGMDNQAMAARSQIGFLDFVVRPMFDPLHRLLGTGLDSAGSHFDENRAKWAKALQDSQEAVEN